MYNRLTTQPKNNSSMMSVCVRIKGKDNRLRKQPKHNRSMMRVCVRIKG
jgi:hypothetical protein